MKTWILLKYFLENKFLKENHKKYDLFVVFKCVKSVK